MNKMYKAIFYIYVAALILISIFLVAWPFPAFFLLDKEAGEAYLDFLFGQTGSQDGSRFAALPFVWGFFSAPLGIVLTPIGIALWYFCETIINGLIKLYKWATNV
jgi:hypothetical protein